MAKRYHKWIDFSNLDANGNKICRWCKTPLTGRRKSICSDKCQTEIEIRCNPSFARLLVYRRDKGICNTCNLDTEKLRKIMRKLEFKLCEKFISKERKTLLKHRINKILVKYNWFKLNKHAWEMDHIVPVRDAKEVCGLEGLQTLCLECHKEKTSRMLRKYE